MMKKILMTLIALIAMAVSAEAQNVYVSAADGAGAYHKSKNCSYLKKTKDVKTLTVADAQKQKLTACKRCYVVKSGKALKAKKTLGKKDAVKKLEPKKAAKKAAPARDEKGRFVKKN